MTMDAFEVQGEWWLPGRPDRKVPGILTFSPEGGAELSLFGSLRSILEEGERSEKDGVVRVAITQAAVERSGSYPRLHGYAGGTAYTLQDCLRVRSLNRTFPGQGSETIRVTRILRGALFEEDEALEATGISFGLTHLVDWIGETGISEEWREDSGTREDVPRFRIEARKKPDRHAVLANGGSVYLKHSVGIAGDEMSDRALTQGFHWRVDQPGRVSMDDLLDLASDMQDLVSIATDRTAAFERVRFWHPDVFREMPDSKRIPETIDLFVEWNTQAERPVRRLHEHNLLFTFEHLGGIDGVRRWMDAADRHRGGLGRVMGTRYAKGMFVSDRSLNCSAALEAFDRDSTGNTGTKFKTRMQRCAALAEDPFTNLVGDVSRWAETIRLERDDVAHHFGRRMRSTGSETYYLWQSLYWLFVICILRDSGAPKEVFDHLQRHSQYQWLLPRIQAVI
jgi:ApeA N-terminal domain 1